MKKLLLLLIITANVALGQIDSTHASVNHGEDVIGERVLSVLVGYNGIKRHFLEAGFAISRLNIYDGHHFGGSAALVSTEIMIDENPTIGPKIGGWISGGMLALGLNTIYYFNKNESSLRLRPEVRIGMSRFKFVYGYNIALSNKDFRRINTNNFSLVVLLKIKTLKNKKRLL